MLYHVLPAERGLINPSYWEITPFAEIRKQTQIRASVRVCPIQVVQSRYGNLIKIANGTFEPLQNDNHTATVRICRYLGQFRP